MVYFEQARLMIAKITLAALLANALLVSAQTPRRPIFDHFEVATIKPAIAESAGRWIRMRSLDRFEARNHTVKTLIAAAFEVSPQAISGGPAWLDTDRWDIQAKTPAEIRPNWNEQMAMLRDLLKERCKLT